MRRCIVTACDFNYFPAAMALLRSLRKTNPDIPVVLFDGGLTPEQRQKISSFAEVIEKEPFRQIPGKGKFSYIGDTTLLKFDAVDLDYDQVLFLDADMVALDSLDAAFDVPRGYVGVVREGTAVKNIFRSRDRAMLMSAIEIDWDRIAFNAGFFVLYPEDWKDIKELGRDLLEALGEDVFTKTKDQQLLNLIFAGRLVELDARFNFSPRYDEGKGIDPAVIHYLEKQKPWHYDYPLGHRYKEFRDNFRFIDHPRIAFIDARRAWRRLVRRP